MPPGSAFHISDGRFATAFHVIGEFRTGKTYSQATMSLEDGRTTAFDITAVNQLRDTAIIRTRNGVGRDLPVIPIAKLAPPEATMLFPIGLDPKSETLRISSGIVGPLGSQPWRFGVLADTLGGMSGGPIVRVVAKDTWEAVSLISHGEPFGGAAHGPLTNSVRALENAEKTASPRSLLMMGPELYDKVRKVYFRNFAAANRKA